MIRFPLALLFLATALLPGSASAEPLVSFPEDRGFLPQSWTEAPINASIEPLGAKLRPAALGILEAALAKYPEKLRQRYLDGVSVVGSLRFYDVSYGGTYMANGRRIVLVYRESFDARGFEQRFHHEFSSILLKQNETLFEPDRWTAANDPSFSYRAAGVVEEQDGDRSEATRVLAAEQEKTGGSGSSLLQIDFELMKTGFLTPYNQVSIEQDLNETAAHLFTNPELWEFCRQYPRIDQKVDVLIDFYRRLDPKMDRLYFRRITLGPTSTPEP
jgi:hypothetical protein